jgi:hypothetical protein
VVFGDLGARDAGKVVEENNVRVEHQLVYLQPAAPMVVMPAPAPEAQ